MLTLSIDCHGEIMAFSATFRRFVNKSVGVTLFFFPVGFLKTFWVQLNVWIFYLILTKLIVVKSSQTVPDKTVQKCGNQRKIRSKMVSLYTGLFLPYLFKVCDKNHLAGHFYQKTNFSAKFKTRENVTVNYLFIISILNHCNLTRFLISQILIFTTNENRRFWAINHKNMFTFQNGESCGDLLSIIILIHLMQNPYAHFAWWGHLRCQKNFPTTLHILH